MPSDPDVLERHFNEAVVNLPFLTADETHKDQSISDILTQDPQATQFVSRLQQHSELLDKLSTSTDGEHAVFVPVDRAWSPACGSHDDLSLLSNHISPHYFSTEWMTHMPNVATLLHPTGLNGPQILRTRFTPDGWHLNEIATLVKGNIVASNGVIHLVDQVLLPPLDLKHVISRKDELSMFAQAIDICGLDATLNGTDPTGRTVFVPVNHAFESLGAEAVAFLFQSEEGRPYLEAIVNRHVCLGMTMYSNFIWPKNNTGARVTSRDERPRLKGRIKQDLPSLLTGDEGQAVSINVTVARYNGVIAMEVNGSSKVVLQDLPASNGVAHAIDSLLPPSRGGNSSAPTSLEELKELYRPYI